MNRGGANTGGGRGIQLLGRGRGKFTFASRGSIPATPSSVSSGLSRELSLASQKSPNESSTASQSSPSSAADCGTRMLSTNSISDDATAHSNGNMEDGNDSFLGEDDPMKKAYEDSNFNSYSGGPGSLLPKTLHVEGRRDKDLIKLYVANIPQSLTKLGLENIFNLYGCTKSVFVKEIPGQPKWGFVEYQKLQEAQSAIQNLDRKPPHDLRVKFAKERETKPQELDSMDSPYCAVNIRSGRGRKPYKMYGFDPKRIYPKRGNSDSTEDNSNGYRPGEFGSHNPSYHEEKNNEVMERITNTDHSGRLVRGGRSFAPSKDDLPPNENNTVLERFKKPVRSEEADAPSIACPFKQGKCECCQTVSATACSVCKAWFCSYTCLEKIWGKHKVVCRPRTVSFRPDGTIDYHESQEEKRVSPTFEKPSQKSDHNSDMIPAKKEDRNEKVPVVKNGTIHQKPSPQPVQAEPDIEHEPEPRTTDDGYIKTDVGLISERNKEHEKPVYVRKVSAEVQVHRSMEEVPVVKAQPSTRKADLNTSASQSAKPAAPTQLPKKKATPEPPIPRGTFSQCIVLFTTPKDQGFYVTPRSLAEAQDTMTENLAEYFVQPRDVADAKIGSIYGAQYVDGSWYRAQVMSFDGAAKEALVHFIDYGNYEDVPISDLMALPQEFVSPPPMAFRIVFVGEKKPFNIFDDIEISPIKQNEDGSWLVRGPGDPEPPEDAEEEEPPAQEPGHEERVDDSAQEIQRVEEPADIKQQPSPSQDTASFPLSRNKYQLVTIMHREDVGVYWVITDDGLGRLIELNGSLQDEARTKITVTPEMNKLYNYQFKGLWCRALLTQLDPCTVFFIDYGNADVVDPAGFRPLPLKLKSTPPLAIRIKLAEGTSAKYLKLDEMDQIKVKAHGKITNSVLALVEGELYVPNVIEYELNKPPERKKRLNHVVSFLTRESDAHVVITRSFGEDYFCGSLQIINNKECSSVTEISQNLSTTKANPSYKATLGDDVIVKINVDSRLYRGYVMSIDDGVTRVALVDLACVDIPSKVAALPPQFKEIPECGVKISLDIPLDTAMSAPLGSDAKLTNVKISGEEVTADLDQLGRVTIVPWAPRVEEALVGAVKLERECEVVITTFHSPQSIYVRPLTSDCLDLLRLIIQDVCAFCLTTGPLTKPPLIGELVCAKWTDCNFYRAMVSKKEKGEFTVIFLDFGNIESVALSDLRGLPDNYKKLPATVVKIGLDKVVGSVFNQKATEIMNELVAHESKLIAMARGINDETSCIPSHNPIPNVTSEIRNILYQQQMSSLQSAIEAGGLTHQGDLRNVVLIDDVLGNVNKALVDVMKPPRFEKPLAGVEIPVFMESDIYYDLLEVNSTIPGVVVGVKNFGEILFVNTTSMFEYIHNTLTPQITAYCQSLPDKSYSPRHLEFILARFEGEWYRALCTSKALTEDGTVVVFFIDYGNYGELSFNDIRPMINDFVAVPAAVKLCKIYGLPHPDTIEADMLTTLMELIQGITEVSIVKVYKGGQLLVWVPSLQEKLREMGIPFNKPVGFK